MQTRTAFFLAMLISAGQPLAAEPAALSHYKASEDLGQDHGPGGTCTWPIPMPRALFVGADRARELSRVASYATIGNRTEVEILSRELREFGLSADELRDAAAHMWPRTHLHGSPSPKAGAGDAS